MGAGILHQLAAGNIGTAVDFENAPSGPAGIGESLTEAAEIHLAGAYDDFFLTTHVPEVKAGDP